MPQPEPEQIPAEAWKRGHAVVALSFGGDLATVGVVVREAVHQPEVRAMLRTGRLVEKAHRAALITLERLVGGQPEIAARVAALLKVLEQGEAGAELLLDVSRVGSAAADIFRESGLYPTPVTVGPDLGDAAKRVQWGEVVGVLRAELQTQRFVIAPGVALAGPFHTRLVREMKSTGDEPSTGLPDPVLIAAGLALWRHATRIPLIVA